MPKAFDIFMFIGSWSTLFDVTLSVIVGVSGYFQSSSISTVRNPTPFWTLAHNNPSSPSIALRITIFSMMQTLCAAPLCSLSWCGGMLFPKCKFPSTLLLAFGTDK